MCEALLHWFALAENSSLEKVESMYINGELESLYRLTQNWYRENGITEVHCYRWETEKRRNPILQSWTSDKRTAKSYSEIRPDGKLIESDFPVDHVLFDVYCLCDHFELDSELGMMPCAEVVIITQERK